MDKKLLELINNAAAGDQEAFAVLKETYRPLIESCVYRYMSPDMTVEDTEDLSQEALIRFFSAVCSFDDRFEKIEFGLYAKICIENGLVSFIRTHRRQNKISTLSLEGRGIGDGEGTRSDPLQAIVDRERTAALFAKIKKELSGYENKIWWMYVSGMTVSEIARVLDVSPRSVSNAIYRIRQKLKRSLGSDK